VNRFGEKLHTLRTRSNLTLSQLAERLGYSTHAYISELEAGKKMPTALLVLRVAREFDVTTDELLKDELELSEPGDNIRA
jgi:transcriptional regulator with XRE-family HTH domain